MKRILTLILVAGLGLAAYPGASLGGSNNNAKIMVHLAVPAGKGAQCSTYGTPGCNRVVTNGRLYPAIYYAYLLVADGDASAGVAGLQCGIDYAGGVSGSGGYSPISIFGWAVCATLEFSSTGWPAPGGGNLITWDTTRKCQRYEPGGPGTGVMAAAGFFYLAAYAEGTLAVTTRPVDGRAKVADCASNEYLIAVNNSASALGSVAFSANGLTYGRNPCGAISESLCHVRGPASVAAGQAGLVYTVDPGEVSPTGYWTVLGNAVLESSDTASATVRATVPGTFSIAYELYSGCVEGCGCYSIVEVHAPTPVEPTHWSRIKAMYPGAR